MINLTKSRQFHIITYLKIDFSFVIRHLTYLIFSINFYNQPFKSIYTIKFFNQLTLNWRNY